MEKRILRYTYFSENTQNAIDCAVQLYYQQTCIFYNLNTFKTDADASENKTKLEHIFKGLTYNFYTLERMSINKGINSFVENDRCNLIAFIGEQSNYIGNDLPRPLLKELDTHLSVPYS